MDQVFLPSHGGFTAAKARRLLPKGHFFQRRREDARKLVPFVRTLARAFRDLDRLSGLNATPVLGVTVDKKASPPQQKLADDRIHAAKQKISSYAKAVASHEQMVVVSGKELSRRAAVRTLKSLEKEQMVRKEKRGKLVVTPPAQPGKVKDLEVRGSKTRPPSYHRRLEVRALRRRVSELEAALTVSEGRALEPPKEVIRVVKEIEIVEKIVEIIRDVPVPAVEPEVVHELKERVVLRFGGWPARVKSVSWSGPRGTSIRMARSKVGAKVWAFDLLGEGSPMRLGLVRAPVPEGPYTLEPTDDCRKNRFCSLLVCQIEKLDNYFPDGWSVDAEQAITSF